jgi:hypothetical protein
MDDSFPFAITTPSLLCLLPSYQGTFHSVASGLVFAESAPPELPKFQDVNGEMSYNVSSMTAQACYLLSKAIDDVLNPVDVQKPGWQYSYASLDMTIQTYAQSLLQTGDPTLHCWPYDICMRYVLLHYISCQVTNAN